MAEHETHQLAAGTVLDDRYEIQKVLGEGGFGITYAGVNRRVDVKVAIKEFFCSDYMGRDCRDTTRIHLKKEEDRERFEKEKAKFLKEARIVGDFINEPGVVDVTDYFETNETAYIVMGYLDGESLKERLQEQKRFESEEIFRTMLPLMETLGKIHECGVIHRDISPDNIMMMKDDTVKLIDFGAARDYSVSMEKSYSVVLKGGYAPREQYDSKGSQGPWTDIYALSATLYTCITGNAPDDALQRILHDELQKPSELGIPINRNLEKIMMKGLSLAPEERYQKMDEMIAAIRAALPEEKPQNKKGSAKKIVIASVIAAAICIFGALGIWYVQTHEAEIKFRGIRTETVFLTPPDDMSAKDFYKAAKCVEERFKVLAGEKNFVWKEEEGIIKVITPLDIYGEADLDYVMDAYITSMWKKTLVVYRSEQDTYTCDITSEDIKSVTVKEGEVGGVPREDYSLPETGDYTYLEVALSDKTAGRMNGECDDILGAKGQPVTMAFDASESGEYQYSFKMITKGDGKTLYLIDMDQVGAYSQLTAHSVMQEDMPGKLNYEYEYPVEWEAPQQSLIAGENQCSEDEIEGKAVLMRYDYSTWESYTGKGAWYNVIAVFKERLDAMNIPYAFGVSYFDDRQVIIKTAQKDMCGLLINELPVSGYNFALTSDWAALYNQSSSGFEEITMVPQGDSTYSIDIQMKEYYVKDMQEGTQAMLDAGEDKLYLQLGPYRVAECEITEPITDGHVTFSKLRFSEEKEITDKMTPVVNFMQSLLIETQMSQTYRLGAVQLLDADGEISQKKDETEFYATFDRVREQELQERMTELGAQFSWSYEYEGENLTIDFGTVEEDRIPEDIFSLAEKIYAENHLGDGEFEAISFDVRIAPGESGIKKRSLYIRISKDYSAPKMSLTCSMFSDGDEKLAKKVEKYIADSEFFQSMLAEDGWKIY